MAKYPSEITDDVLARFAHISNEQITVDWSDTKAEVRQLLKVQGPERIIAENHLDEHQRRLAAFRANAYTQKIAEREEFAAFLLALDKARQAKEEEARV